MIAERKAVVIIAINPTLKKTFNVVCNLRFRILSASANPNEAMEAN